MDRPPTLGDVAECYRLFLEREVESGSVAVMQMADVPTLWSLINRFAGSTEAMRRRIHRAAGLINDMYDPSVIRMETSQAQRKELLTRTLERWNRCGRGFAYDHLFRDPRLFDDRSEKWNREMRFEFGREELEQLFSVGRRNGIAFASNASMLALGCEVGFLAAAATERIGYFLGIEAGGAAFAQGRDALQARGIREAELLRLRAFLDSGSGHGERTFDIFYSVMLLQHAPPPVSSMLLDACLGRINPGGYAYFQVPCQIYDYGYATDIYLSTLNETDDSGEIHALPQAHVLERLAQHDLVPIEILPEGRLGPMGFSFTFFARKRGGTDDRLPDPTGACPR